MLYYILFILLNHCIFINKNFFTKVFIFCRLNRNDLSSDILIDIYEYTREKKTHQAINFKTVL